MKSIDIKSLIIGVLLTSTIFLGVAAVPKDTGKVRHVDEGAWDEKQTWRVIPVSHVVPPITDKERRIRDMINQGMEPFAATDKKVYFRFRIK
mgnify:CR=1 FL=1